MRGVVIIVVTSSCLLGCDAAEGPCDPDGFAAVTIELQRSASEPISPFLGTASIKASLHYEDCLADFFISESPNYQFDGVDGGEVRDDWMNGRLCDKQCHDKAIPECAVTDMTQTLNTGGATDLTFLSVTYALASDDIEGLHLPVGPFPTESVAGCSPLVSLEASSVQGFDANGECLWKVASFDNPTAAVGQTASITIFTEPCE